MIPPGLRRSDATLQTTLEVATPSEHESEVAARIDVCTASADGARAGERRDDGTEVEVTLVDADLLHPGYDLADGAPHRLRVLPVEGMARADEDDLGAPPQRLGRAHSRVDAEAPGDVVGGGDDAPALRVPADDEWLRSQRGVLELLDRGEERIQVEMGENRHMTNGTVPP